MIKVTVGMSLCQHYGQCVAEAPAVFSLNSEDRLEYRAKSEDSELAAIEDAIDICPMQAISITD